MSNIKKDDKVKIIPTEENPTSVSKANVLQNSAKHDLNEEQLEQNLKNYIDCNVDGMVYNEKP